MIIDAPFGPDCGSSFRLPYTFKTIVKIELIGWDLTKEKVITAMAVEELEKNPGTEESERTRAFCDVVIHVCPECKARRMITPDGPVAVTEEDMRPFERGARKMEIPFDEEYTKGEALPPGEVAGDVPADKERGVLALNGRQCAKCGRRLGLHIHHIIFRSRGGSNTYPKMICVCRGCHEAVHLGTLEVFRDSRGDIYWKTRAERLTALLEDEVKELAAIPAVSVVEVKLPAPAVPPDPPAPSAPPKPSTPSVPSVPSSPSEPSGPSLLSRAVESAAEKRTLDDAVLREAEHIAEGLERTLGYPRRDARARVAKALDLLGSLGRPPTGDEIVNTAVRGHVATQGVRSSMAVETDGSGTRPADPRRRTPPSASGDGGAGSVVS
jgi:hypothetical protein